MLKSWIVAKLWDRLHGLRLKGSPGDEIRYFAFGATITAAPFADAAACTRWSGARQAACEPLVARLSSPQRGVMATRAMWTRLSGLIRAVPADMLAPR